MSECAKELASKAADSNSAVKVTEKEPTELSKKQGTVPYVFNHSPLLVNVCPPGQKVFIISSMLPLLKNKYF